MSRASSLLVLAVLLEACAGDGGESSGEKAIRLTIAAGTVGQEAALLEDAATRFEAAHPGVQVRLLEVPDLATDRLALYLQYLGARSKDVDLYQIDVIWPGILAGHAVDLTGHVPAPEMERHFEAVVANNTVEGKLVAIPWFAAVGLLYYRTDLLERYGFESPPATWDELERMARAVQDGERAAGAEDFWGFVWQGKAYEGLTCNALEWQASSGGGTILDETGRVTVNNEAAVGAMQRAARWVGTISPPGVTTYAEEEARALWQTGKAAFMRSWPYAYSLGMEPDPETGEKPVIAGRFAVGVLPSGGEGGTGALGGWQLMVSRYSRHVDLAAELARFLASPEEQRIRVVRGSLIPTVRALYRDPVALEAVPFLGMLEEALSSAVPRPSAAAAGRYNRVSEAYFTAVHDVLSGATASVRMEELEKELLRVLR